MFANLTDRLSQTVKKLRGQARLTEENIKDTLNEIRISLLEADVALPVVKSFIDQVRENVIGKEVIGRLNPGQVFIQQVHKQLVDVLGGDFADLELNVEPPAVILVAGLQGSGKTTTVAKVASLLKSQHNKRVLVASTDVYRPAAIDQLITLAKHIEIDYLETSSRTPLDIAQQAISKAKQQFYDAVIIDTAGRLHIDEAMMDEIKQIHQLVKPAETLLVVDSMTGQDAVNTAKTFNETINITGVVLTKIDGDARGGAALSIKYVTGKPIKFIGVGEKTDALEAFHPDRIASRILGQGDVLSLVEEAERKLDKEKSEKLAKKLKKGKSFDLNDFREQIQQMNQMGGMMGIMSKLPIANSIPQMAKDQLNDKNFSGIVAIINSMTPQERRFPKVINGSRKRRIANGSGTQIQEINKLLKQFTQMQKMMKKFKKGGSMKKMMRGLPPGMKGSIPDDLF